MAGASQRFENPFPIDDGVVGICASASHRPDASDRLVRRMAVRYSIVLVAVASLLIADQVLIQPLLVRLNGYAPVINVAGRQRMLSQKLAKEALAMEAATSDTLAELHRLELMRTAEQWSAAHSTLVAGGTSRVASALHALDPDVAMMQAAAIELAKRSTAEGKSFRAPPVRDILVHEARFLAGMEGVVTMLEAEARQQVFWLRLCGTAAVGVAIVLLLSLYAFVVRPATLVIRRQLAMLAASDERHRDLAELLGRARDDLEIRVRERTNELSRTNAALEREMSQRQCVEARMRRLSSDLAHATRVTALGELATGLAHELNQPLGAVANYAGTCELLLERDLPQNHASHRAINEIKRAALRAGEIVRRMRNFVKRSPEQRSAVELNNLVREVTQLCEPELRRFCIELTLDLSDEPTAVFADPIQIQQVLVNLIQNAIQAMPAKRQKRLQIRTSSTADGVQVDVIDSGPGFLQPDGEKPFEPFFSTKADGLGMGLAISQTLIEEHDGRIWAGNCPDGGAIVSFCLPEYSTDEASQRASAHSLCG